MLGPIMDMFSGVVAWLLVVFLQLCPLDHLAKGQVYVYQLEGKARRVSVTVDAFDAKAKTATLTARLQPMLFDSQTRAHTAKLSWASGRQITSLSNEGREMLDAPLKLPAPNLLMSTDPSGLFKPAKAAAPTAKPATVEGVKGEVKPKAVRYEHEKDYAVVATDPKLGMVRLTLSQWGEVSDVTLVTLK